MSKEEVIAELKEQKWSFLLRWRKERGYIYAAKKIRKKRVEHYICPLANVAELTCSALHVKLGITPPVQADQAITGGECTGTPKVYQELGMAS